MKKIITAISAFAFATISLLSAETGLLGAAATAVQNKDYKTAVELYSKAIEKNPAHADSYYGRALAKSLDGNCEAAIDDYSSAIKLNDKLVGAVYGKGVCLTKLSKYDEAVAEFSKAISLDSKKADYYYARGYAKMLKNDSESALKDFEEALRIDPGYSSALYAAASIHFKAEKYSLALPYLRKFTELVADDNPLRAEAKRMISDITSRESD